MDHEIRVASVKEYLSYLDEKLHEYSTEYDAMKNSILLYTSVLTYRIEEYARKHVLSAVNIYFDVLIALMRHDYMDRFVQLKYGQLKPMQEQIHKGNRIYSISIQGYPTATCLSCRKHQP